LNRVRMNGPETYCDLHLHSHYSDGNLSPRELVKRARLSGLAAVSITDHDEISGQGEALRAGERYGVEVITGIEFSVMEKNLEIHLLGYLIDPECPTLLECVRSLKEARRERAHSILAKLVGQGVQLQFEEISKEAGKGAIGRLHIARVLLRKGLIERIKEAFDRYIGSGAPCYVPKMVLGLDRVMGLIKEAGGVAVWAHPGASISKSGVLERLCKSGVRGIETQHPNHTAEIEEKIRAVARERGMICTGGSDYHFEEAVKARIGEIRVPYSAVQALRRAADKSRKL
jgi:predicted metal-dependent phosphoesterase TrpH